VLFPVHLDPGRQLAVLKGNRVRLVHEVKTIKIKSTFHPDIINLAESTDYASISDIFIGGCGRQAWGVSKKIKGVFHPECAECAKEGKNSGGNKYLLCGLCELSER